MTGTSAAPEAMRAATNRRLAASAVAVVLIFFVLPAVMAWVDAATSTGTKYGLIPLLLVNPVVFFVLGLLTGRRLGARAGGSIVVGLAIFAASALIVYDDSAPVYALLYVPCALLGWGAGAALRRVRGTRTE